MKVIPGELVWCLHATHGFPLELSLPILAAKYDAIPAWRELLDAARADGTNLDRLVRRIQEVAGEAYPPEAASHVREKLPLLLSAIRSGVLGVLAALVFACSGPSAPEFRPPSDAYVCQAWPDPEGILCCNMATLSCTWYPPLPSLSRAGADDL